MDIKKIIEQEVNKLLQEAQVVVGSLANPLEFSQFKNWEQQQLPKIKNADVYYFNPAVEGQKTKEDKVFLAHYLDAKWSGKTDDTGKTRKDIKLQLPQYSAKEIAAQISIAQQIMLFVNQAIGQRPDVASEKMNRVKKVGDIQQEVNMLRRDYPNEFPSKIKTPNLTKRLQKIFAWVKANPDKIKKTLLGGQVPVPAATTPAPQQPAQPATAAQPASAPAQQANVTTTTKQVPGGTETTETSSATLTNTNVVKVYKTEQNGEPYLVAQVQASNGDIYEGYGKLRGDVGMARQNAIADARSKIAKGQPPAIPDGSIKLKESKDLRGMIIKELMALLK
jgi:hypothetical protein